MRNLSGGDFGLHYFFQRRHLLMTMLTVLGTALLPTSVVAQTDTTAPNLAVGVPSESIDALFQKAGALLQKHQSLRAVFEITTTYSIPFRDTQETGVVSLSRPNLLRIDIARYRRVKEGSDWEPTGNGSVTVSDGKQILSVTTHPKSAQYTRQAANDVATSRALTPLLPLRTFFTGEGKVPSGARIEGKQTAAGESFTVVQAKAEDAVTRYWFDSDGYLRQVNTDTVSGGGSAMFAHREIRLGKPVALTVAEQTTTFSYQPPAEAVLVEQRSSEKRGPLAIGDTAPDLVAEDINGRPVHLSEYAGKVVVLKFWATWCWPCRQSLPETEALAKQYGDDVVVLAVALWDSRKAFREWVAQYGKTRRTVPEKLAIRFVFDPRPSGQDAGSSVYGIHATPTQFVIGRDGVITAFQEGYNGPSPELAQAVAAALGKPGRTASR